MTQTHTWSDLIRACNLLAMIENGNGRPGEADYLNKREMGRQAKEAREIIEPIAVACRDHSINPAAMPDLLDVLTRLDDHVTELIDLYGDQAPITAGIIDITTSARAALAKAKDGE